MKLGGCSSSVHEDWVILVSCQYLFLLFLLLAPFLVSVSGMDCDFYISVKYPYLIFVGLAENILVTIIVQKSVQQVLNLLSDFL